MPQSQQSPNRGQHQRLARHAINPRISAVPTAAWTHTVVQHGCGKLPSSLRVGRQGITAAAFKSDERERRRLNPAARFRRPTPPSIRIVNGMNFVLRGESGEKPLPRRSVSRPVFAYPFKPGRNAGSRIASRLQGPATERSYPAARLFRRSCWPRTVSKLSGAKKLKSASHSVRLGIPPRRFDQRLQRPASGLRAALRRRMKSPATICILRVPQERNANLFDEGFFGVDNHLGQKLIRHAGQVHCNLKFGRLRLHHRAKRIVFAALHGRIAFSLLNAQLVDQTMQISSRNS